MNTKNIQIAVIQLSLNGLSNDVLADAMLSLNRQHSISIGRPVYDAFLGADLITSEGKPKDEFLIDAVAAEIDRRVHMGLFN